MSSAEKRSDPGERAAGPAFECRSVTVEFLHKFSRKRIIEDISFLVRSGEFLTIVGPSGTGKTTLLRAMGGLTPTASGSVLVHGKQLDGPSRRRRHRIPGLFHALLQWRTVAANVAFGIERKLDHREIEQRVHDALGLVGLEKNAEDYPWQLSGRHAAARSNRARFGAASGRDADGRTVCRARCHDQSVDAGRTSRGCAIAPGPASSSSPTTSRRRSIWVTGSPC